MDQILRNLELLADIRRQQREPNDFLSWLLLCQRLNRIAAETRAAIERDYPDRDDLLREVRRY